MRHLLNTLFVTSEDIYLSLDNENVVINKNGTAIKKLPLRMFEQILYFGYMGASPALLGKCAEYGIAVCFYKPSGRFLARVMGNHNSNVLLRKEQYRISDTEEFSCKIARNFIVGKLYNSHSVLERAKRDHALTVDVANIEQTSREIMRLTRLARNCTDLAVLRGLEGDAASLYFSQFNELILQNKGYFRFTNRNKRPPADPVNALLSFAYTILANDCAAALEGTGLDPYIGFLHRDRPGRLSLALDLMEEFRSIIADRFVLTLINNRVINEKSFNNQENGSVLLNDDGRKTFFEAWQKRKQDVIMHPFLQEKIPWGLVPFVQAQLLARYIRGDIDEYPSYLWK